VFFFVALGINLNPLSSSIQTVEVRYINEASKEKRRSHKRQYKSKWPLYLAIKIQADDNVHIISKGFASEWKGEILVTGTTTAPVYHGLLTVDEGNYLYNAREYHLKQGTITLSGEADQDPSVSIVAGTEGEKHGIEGVVKGPASNPQTSFRSDPPLSQKEILSLLIFNRNIADIDATQNAELNHTMTTLSSGNEGPDILNKFRNSVGIDRIDISRKENSENTDVSVQVGKYISRGTMISFSRSITQDANNIAPANRFGLQTEITNNLKVQAEVDDDGNGQLNFLWRKHY